MWAVSAHTCPTVRGPLAACMPPPALLSPVALRIPSPITTPHPPSHHPFPAPLLELPNMACEGKVRPCLLAHGPQKPLSWLHSWGAGSRCKPHSLTLSPSTTTLTHPHHTLILGHPRPKSQLYLSSLWPSHLPKTAQSHPAPMLATQVVSKGRGCLKSQLVAPLLDLDVDLSVVCT